MTRFLSSGGHQDRAALRDGAIEQDAAQFDIALSYPEKLAVKAAMRGAGVEQEVRSTLRGLAGEGFSPAEFDRLQERMLDKATMDDVRVLWGIEAGAPIVISPKQKTVVDGLFGRLGGDPLAEKARSAYRGTLQSGRVKVK